MAPLPAGTLARLVPLRDEIQRHLEERDPDSAFPLFREMLADRGLQGRLRGEVAASLGWALLEHYPEDPVPHEAREALAVAVAWAPASGYTPQLQAFIHVHDGEPVAGLACPELALSRLPHQDLNRAAVLCIASAAHHDLGHDVEASRLRESAISLWPWCDLIPWLEQRTNA
jgi:hypothetical protein